MQPRVVVAGAGVAGLAAAWRLARAGVAVTVLERTPRAGGRAACAEGEEGAYDPVAHRVLPTDAHLHALVRASGTARELLPLCYPKPRQAGSAAVVHTDRPGLAAVARLPGVGLLEALRLARLPRLLVRWRDLLDPARPECAAPLDDRSLADFGRLYFGAGVVANWMEPLLAEASPLDERETSRVLFLLRHAREAWISPGCFRAPVGGMAEALAARLEARLETRLEAAEPGARGGLALHLRGPEGDSSEDADALVLSVPADDALRVAGPLLAAAEHDVLGAVRYAASISWVARLPRSPVGLITRLRVPRAVASPLANVTFEPRFGPDGRRSEARATLVTRDPWARSHLHESDDGIAKALEASLTRWTGSHGEGATSLGVHRYPRAWPEFPVGHYRALARLRRVAADRRAAGRRVYLAGDWAAGPTLEDAARSGARAASDLLADLGISDPT